MAWATKYRMLITNYEAGEVTVDFQTDGWGGAITSLTAGADPINLSYHAEDKHQTIVGSTLEIQLVYEAAVDELFVEEDQVIRVRVTWLTKMSWYGFITPFQYYKKMGTSPHYATFLATDQLGLLKDIEFKTSGGDPYFYINTEFYFLTQILSKTGLEIGLTEGVNIYDSTFDADPEDSPLAQTYMYPERYWDETNDAFASCYDVLEDILKKYGARICQVNGEWYIQRPNSLWSKHTERTYLTNWTYDSDETVYTRYNKGTEVWTWLARPEMTKLKRVGRVDVFTDPGYKSNIIKNSTFDDFTQDGGSNSGSLLYWTISGSVVLEDGYVDLGALNAPSRRMECTNYLMDIGGLRFVMEFKATWASTTAASIYMKFKAGSGVGGDGFTERWFTESGWSTIEEFYKYDIYTDLGGVSMADYAVFTIDFPGKWDDTQSFGSIGDFTVEIYELDVDLGGVASSHLYVRNVRLEPQYLSWWPEQFKYTKENAATSLNKLETTINHMDAGDSFLLSPWIVKTDISYYLQGSATSLDNIYQKYIIGDYDTTTTPVTIQELLAKQLLEATYSHKDIIMGTLRGAYNYNKALLDPDLVDSYGYPKHFIAQEATWDLRRNQWYGTWVEVGPIYELIEEHSSSYGPWNWASETYAGVGIINGNEIDIDETVSGTMTATSDAFTVVLGEMIRIKANLTLVAGQPPNYSIDSQTGTLANGMNYLEFRMATAGSKTFAINHTNGEVANCVVTIVGYRMSGL